jgi:hypothetical protein
MAWGRLRKAQNLSVNAQSLFEDEVNALLLKLARARLTASQEDLRAERSLRDELCPHGRSLTPKALPACDADGDHQFESSS